MSSQLIKFANEDFFAYPSKILFWKRLNTIIVADLHLGKSVSFARHKQFLPPYDTKETLNRLFDCINEFKPTKLIIVGDLIHDIFSIKSLEKKDHLDFIEYAKKIDFIWIKGNHDSKIEISGLQKALDYTIDEIIFSHIPIKTSKYQICGHFHPKVKITHRGKSIYKPTFVHNTKIFILPSFGVLTGGLNIDHDPIKDLLGKKINIFPVGKDKVYKL